MNVKVWMAGCAVAGLCVATSAAAQPTLVAVGSLPGSAGDLAVETAGPLENGVAGNRLGGLGSGLAHAGGDVFVSVPDRGPNAFSYDACVDDTTSYIPRFETLRLELTSNSAYPASGLPLRLTPTLLKTTLMWTAAPLVYGSGLAGCGAAPLPAGAPALNSRNVHYFSGRSDNFDGLRLSTDSQDARLDPESVRVVRNGTELFVSDEYGPYIYRFNRDTGKRNAVITLPDAFAVAALYPAGADEISSNVAGRVANKGMEGLAITPDGSTLVGIMQSPLIQDGGTNASTTRIVTIDIESGAVTHEYAYRFDNIGTAAAPKYGTASEILAVNDHVFLVDERDGKGLGDGSTAKVKRIYLIDLTNAIDVQSLTGDSALASAAVPKSLFLDAVKALGDAGIAAAQVPAKLEGLAFGDDVQVNGSAKHTLFIANDNDFDASSGNPNQFFVFAFGDADLKGHAFVPQAFNRP